MVSSAGLRFHVGTDVGGTFTDLWAIAEDGRQAVVKAPTTPDIIGGIRDAIALAATRFQLGVPDFCRAVERFGHGTTAGLNALLTGHASSAAVITTEGFGDTMEIGRLKRQVAGLTGLEAGDYLNRGRWPAVVPRTRVLEVAERSASGSACTCSIRWPAARARSPAGTGSARAARSPCPCPPSPTWSPTS